MSMTKKVLIALMALALCGLTLYVAHTPTVIIDGNQVPGFAGLGIAGMGISVALLALVLSLCLAGVVIVGISAFIIGLFALTAGVLAIVLLPLFAPILLVIVIIAL